MTSDGKRLAVFGMTGSGKTVYVTKIIEQVPRLIVFDPKRSYRKTADQMRLTRLASLEAMQAYLMTHEKGNFRVLFEPEPEYEPDELHAVSQLVEALQDDFANGMANRKTMLLVEEAHLGAPNPMDRKKNGFARLVTMGREWGVDIITVTQRPQDISKRVRENVNRVAVFKVSGEDAVFAAAKTINRSGVAEAIEGLIEPGAHVYFDDAGGEWALKPPIPL